MNCLQTKSYQGQELCQDKKTKFELITTIHILYSSVTKSDSTSTQSDFIGIDKQ